MCVCVCVCVHDKVVRRGQDSTVTHIYTHTQGSCGSPGAAPKVHTEVTTGLLPQAVPPPPPPLDTHTHTHTHTHARNEAHTCPWAHRLSCHGCNIRVQARVVCERCTDLSGWCWQRSRHSLRTRMTEQARRTELRCARQGSRLQGPLCVRPGVLMLLRRSARGTGCAFAVLLC